MSTARYRSFPAPVPGEGQGREPSLCLSPRTGERTQTTRGFHGSTLNEKSWNAELRCEFVHAAGRTRLSARHHRGPLVVQRPFYPEGEVCHVYVVHPPGGVVGGDQLSLDMSVHAGAHALITTPASTKFYKAGGQLASQTQRLTVRDGVLEWLPQDNIFFADAAVRLDTVVHLQGDARFIGWEVACYGRPASGEALGNGKVLQSFELWKDDAPLLLDRLRVNGAGDMMSACWGLAGNVVLGTLLAYPFLEADLADLRAIALLTSSSGHSAVTPAQAGVQSKTKMDPGFCRDDGCAITEVQISCTVVDNVLVCRAAGGATEKVKQILVQLWQHLRPKILNRPAVPPRIWAT